MTQKITPPTCHDLAEGEGFESVASETGDGWRYDWQHSCFVFQEIEVFKRLSDSTFWQARYELSSDVKTCTLRDGNAIIQRVYPVTTTVVTYEIKPSEQTE